MTKLLLVEDDTNMGMLLKENLINKGFDTQWCRDGQEGLESFRKNRFDLCILDVMLPVKDGFTLAKEIKAINKDVPVIFLTARGLDKDKVKGFELGCDDYITKPFSTQELCMRINAILKRTYNKQVEATAKVLSLGRYSFDYTRMVLSYDNQCKKLSSKEVELIYILLSHKNELVQRNMILEKVWGNDDYFAGKSMDVYISKIRKMLRDDPRIEILNAYGIGFKLTVNE
jgi:DNA-binding response OmpR family regulator